MRSFAGCFLGLLILLVSANASQTDETEEDMERLESQLLVLTDDILIASGTLYSSARPPPSSHPSSMVPASVDTTVSASPSTTVTPSFSPSSPGSPSLSASPSFAPSSSPAPSTSMPSISSSPTVSAMPSPVPSSSQVPSSFPSAEPSMEPSNREPSSVPSQSAFPSSMPSSSASPSGSLAPSFIPTTSPSTSEPSAQPSLSLAPTDVPSHIPSSFPSSFPTMECHDVASYRSPINNFTCVDHAGTDCTKWRFLGLNAEELEELVENCPVSCRIDCGSFSTVAANVSFILDNIPGLLDVTTQVPLEQTTMKFFPNYVRSKAPTSTFVLTKVVLLSQELLSRRRSVGRRVRRQLQTNADAPRSVQLRVKLSLIGFTIELADSVLTQLVEDGISAQGYVDAIQMSSTFFANANILSAAQIEPSQVESESDSGYSKTSAATIILSVLGSLAAIGLFAGAFIFQRRNDGGWVSIFRMGRPKQLNSPVGAGSPLQVGSPLSHNRSPEASEYTGSTQVQANTNSFASRILNSFSRSRDSGTTGADTPPSPEDFVETQLPPQHVEHPEPHPLAKIIPPMIVIDNIDEDDDGADTSRNDGRGVLPIKHVEASRGFQEALNRSCSSDTPAVVADMLYNYSSFGDNVGLLSPRERALSEIFSGDDKIDDDASVSSTPVKGSEMDVEVPLRQTLSSGSLKDFDMEEVLEDFMRSEWDNDDLSGNAERPPSYSRYTRARFLSTSPNRQSLGHKSTIEGKVAKTPTKPAEMDESSSRRRSLSPIAAPSPHATSNQNGLTIPALNVDTIPPVHPNWTKSRSGTSPLRHERHASDEIRYTFEAPTNTRLGLIIESSRMNGSRVHSIKDYSPLLGLLQVGDRIVKVDGINTVQMETLELMRLLGRNRGTIGTIRITVARALDRGSIPVVPLKKRPRKKHSSMSSTDLSVPGSLVQSEIELGEGSIERVALPMQDDDADSSFHFIGAQDIGED